MHEQLNREERGDSGSSISDIDRPDQRSILTPHRHAERVDDIPLGQNDIARGRSSVSEVGESPSPRVNRVDSRAHPRDRVTFSGQDSRGENTRSRSSIHCQSRVVRPSDNGAGVGQGRDQTPVRGRTPVRYGGSPHDSDHSSSVFGFSSDDDGRDGDQDGEGRDPRDRDTSVDRDLTGIQVVSDHATLMIAWLNYLTLVTNMEE